MDDKDIEYHLSMLFDLKRVDAFNKTFLQLKENLYGKDWVEIGTGLGILSYLASKSNPSGKIYTIEYNKCYFKWARRNFKQLNAFNIYSIRGSSYEFSNKIYPSVLFTETVGSLGIDENIVELTYDFKKKYSTIKQIIPSKIIICWQAFESVSLTNNYDRFHKQLDKYDYEGFLLESLKLDLESASCRKIINRSIHDAVVTSKPKKIISYLLGQDEKSDFSYCINLKKLESSYINLFFVVEVSSNILLTNAVNSEITHWSHNYIKIDKQYSKLAIQYESKKRKFSVSYSE